MCPMTVIVTMSSVILLLFRPADCGVCPLPQHLSPCICADAGKMLDVSCSEVSFSQLREVLDVLALTRYGIWFLRIVATDLSNFPKVLLQSLNLRNLVLIRCNISAISRDMFSGHSIQSLDLSSNSLDRVPSRSLARLKSSLTSLCLDFNRIETLEAYAFSDLDSLLWVSLYGNWIHQIDSRTFLGTERSLTRLNLGGNRLEQVPRYALQRLRCLQDLRLHNNNISEILAENLPPSLYDLELSGNELTRLESRTFSLLHRLSSLHLEDNRIVFIHEDAFYGIHGTLEWLKLGGNLLTSVPRAALRRLTRLRQLDLRRNLISKIEKDDFQGYGKTLRFIFLQKNRIKTIAEGALDVLGCAEWLSVHSNAITELPQRIFSLLIDRLKVFDVHDNPYNCDCHILWFRDWLLAKGRDVANLPGDTRCNATQEPVAKLLDGIECSSSIKPRAQMLTLVFALLAVLVRS